MRENVVFVNSQCRVRELIRRGKKKNVSQFVRATMTDAKLFEAFVAFSTPIPHLISSGNESPGRDTLFVALPAKFVTQLSRVRPCACDRTHARGKEPREEAG